MVDVINFDGEMYPSFQGSGNAARFIIPFAQEVCKGNGLDIGAGNLEWGFPGAVIVDPKVRPGFDAYKLPPGRYDYIFSSHCLEHLTDWVGALDLWRDSIYYGGVIFLYLPHPDQKYWRPFNNRKHIHSFTPQIIKDYFEARRFRKVFVSERDLNHSFAVIAQL